MSEKIDPQLIGQTLLQRGFKDFMLYLFRCVEGRPFIVEPIHEELFKTFEDIYNQKITRLNVNIAPRCGKTVISKYFIVYCITKNPRCNFIYTSYSQMLLKDIAREMQSILESDIYKAMFPIGKTYEEIESDAVNEFWKEYIFSDTKGRKTTFSSNKIVTAYGGVILFASLGATITGFGASVRGAKGFTGGIWIDDGNKPADIRSETLTDNVRRYFTETLLSRLNNPNGLICNIQQRLGLNDLTAYLEEKYSFTTLKRPLLDNKGNCLLPSQYTPERIKELQIDAYMWMSQYMQEPFKLGGQMIKSEWFKYYTEYPTLFNKMFITADTAQKTKEYNDYSVFCVWGVYNTSLYLIDMIRGKWEAPDLLEQVKGLITRYRIWREKRLSEVLIEDKSSGTGLIQTLKRECLVPIRPIQVDKDKVTRVDDALPYIANGYVYLPYNKDYNFNKDLINECELFARDMSHKHDDIVDNITMAIQYVSRKTSIYDAI